MVAEEYVSPEQALQILLLVWELHDSARPVPAAQAPSDTSSHLTMVLVEYVLPVQATQLLSLVLSVYESGLVGRPCPAEQTPVDTVWHCVCCPSFHCDPGVHSDLFPAPSHDQPKPQFERVHCELCVVASSLHVPAGQFPHELMDDCPDPTLHLPSGQGSWRPWLVQ